MGVEYRRSCSNHGLPSLWRYAMNMEKLQRKGSNKYCGDGKEAEEKNVLKHDETVSSCHSSLSLGHPQ